MKSVYLIAEQDIAEFHPSIAKELALLGFTVITTITEFKLLTTPSNRISETVRRVQRDAINNCDMVVIAVFEKVTSPSLDYQINYALDSCHNICYLADDFLEIYLGIQSLLEAKEKQNG